MSIDQFWGSIAAITWANKVFIIYSISEMRQILLSDCKNMITLIWTHCWSQIWYEKKYLIIFLIAFDHVNGFKRTLANKAAIFEANMHKWTVICSCKRGLKFWKGRSGSLFQSMYCHELASGYDYGIILFHWLSVTESFFFFNFQNCTRLFTFVASLTMSFEN